MKTFSISHVGEHSPEDIEDEVLVHVAYHAVEQQGGTALGNEGDDLVRADEARVSCQLQQHAVSLAEVQQLGTVEVLPGGGDGGDGRSFQDLLLVGRSPVAVEDDEVGGAHDDVVGDLGHVEAVCQLERADEVAHLLLRLANVDAGLGSARHQEQLQTHHLLLEDVHEAHLLLDALLEVVLEHGLEVAAEVAEQLLRDVQLVELARGAIVVDGINALHADDATVRRRYCQPPWTRG